MKCKHCGKENEECNIFRIEQNIDLHGPADPNSPIYDPKIQELIKRSGGIEKIKAVPVFTNFTNKKTEHE